MNSFNTLTRNLNTKPIEYKYTTIANYISPGTGGNYGISLDSNSNLYYTNSTNADIVKVDTKISSTSTTTYYTTIPANDTTFASYYSQTDNNNTMFVFDVSGGSSGSHRLSKFTNGTKGTIFTSPNCVGNNIAFDNLNNLFTSDSLKVGPLTTGISVFFAPNYTTGYSILPPTGGTVSYANIAADGSTKASQLNSGARYRYNAFVNKDILYVSSAEFIIQMKLSDIYANYENPGNIPIYKFAGTGTVATITSDINGQLATDVTLNASRGMAFDKFGNAFIADYNAKMIFKVNIATNRISLIIAPTPPSGSTYISKITTTLFSTGPFYIVIDSNRNKLYISNFGTPSNILVVT